MKNINVGRYILTVKPNPDPYYGRSINQELEGKKGCSRSLLKYVVLVSLTLQNTVCILIMKYVFMQEKKIISSTAVCLAEVLKVFCSFVLMIIYEKSWNEVGSFFYNSFVKTPLDTLNMMVPAIAYVIMNNLTYVSTMYLDVITYQIISQLKIPVTVILSLLLLRTTYRRLQYFSLVILTIGVVIVVQFTDVKEHTRKANPAEKTIGYIACAVASLLSGFAGVYFERILKKTTLSVWARNLQLSAISVPFTFLQAYTYDYVPLKEKGFFYEYNAMVWAMILIQASGGLTVALSVKLADNVSKGYATSAAILLSGFISIIVFHYRFSNYYLYACGVALVIISIPMYTFSFSLSSNIEPQKIDYEGKECYI